MNYLINHYLTASFAKEYFQTRIHHTETEKPLNMLLNKQNRGILGEGHRTL